MNVAYIWQGSNLVFVADNKTHTITTSHPNYTTIIEAVKVNDFEKVLTLIDIPAAIEKFSQGTITVTNDTVMWRNQVLHNALTTRILDMFRQGFTIEPMVNFLERLMRNPSKRAVDELYLFLEKCSLPITPDGCFLAYKNVRDDYFDIYSGTVLNKPFGKLTDEELQLALGDGIPASDGAPIKTVAVVQYSEPSVTKVVMERSFVDDNRDRTCSQGLHFCSLDYLKSYSGAHTLIVKIDPADVVSIPSDYNDTKGRTCAYTIVGEHVSEDRYRREAFTKVVEDIEPVEVAPRTTVHVSSRSNFVAYVHVDRPGPFIRRIPLQQMSAGYQWHPSVEDAEAATNVPAAYIRRVLRGQRHTAGGYEWIPVDSEGYLVEYI